MFIRRCCEWLFVIDGYLAVNDIYFWICACSLDVTDGGLAAIVRLVNGDLRKALNILQVVAFFLKS